MSDIEDQLGAILGNPQMMQQIMNLAQSMNSPGNPGPSEEKQEPKPKSGPAMPSESDMTLLNRFSHFAKDSSIDNNQRALLKALAPYISNDRVDRLERAMHAAKLAQFASGFLNAGGLQFLSGR